MPKPAPTDLESLIALLNVSATDPNDHRTLSFDLGTIRLIRQQTSSGYAWRNLPYVVPPPSTLDPMTPSERKGCKNLGRIAALATVLTALWAAGLFGGPIHHTFLMWVAATLSTALLMSAYFLTALAPGYGDSRPTRPAGNRGAR